MSAHSAADAAAATLTIATIVGWLPAVAAFLSIVYTAIRIWESRTFQRLMQGFRK